MRSRYFEMIEWSIFQLIISLLLIGIYYFLCKNDNKNSKKIFQNSDKIIMLLLILISGLRCNSGSDYYNYYLQYVNVLNWYDSLSAVLVQRFQNGYILLSYLTNKFIGGQTTIFIVVALIIYIPLIRILRKYSKSPWKSFGFWMLLGYFLMSMNIIKQYIAMIFIMISFNSYYKKKYLRYVLWSGVACFFHLSAIYSIICIPISIVVKKTKKLYRIILIISIISFILFNFIGTKVFMLFIPQKYYVYIYAWLVGDLEIKLKLGGICVTLLYIFFIKLLLKKLRYLSNYERMILNFSICMLPFLVLSIHFYILNRVAYFGLQMLIIILPSIYSLYKTKISRVLFNLIILFYSIAFSILCAENNYYNYSTIFNSQPMSILEYVRKSLK